MEENKNRALVYTALKNVKGNTYKQEDDHLKIIEDLGFESIDVIDLLFEIEQLSGVVITLGDLTAFLKSHSEGRFQNLKIKDLIEYLDAQSK